MLFKKQGKHEFGRERRSGKELSHERNVLTRILDGGDNEAEAVREGAPRVGDVFQCHEVRARINRAHGLLRVLAGQVCLENKRNAARSMRQSSRIYIYIYVHVHAEEEEQPRSRFHGCWNAIGQVEDGHVTNRLEPVVFERSVNHVDNREINAALEASNCSRFLGPDVVFLVHTRRRGEK